MNLLSNAFKYTPNGKNILITVTFDKNALNFSIKDEGKGFDLYQIDTLFKRFETLGQKDNNLSSGIGLSLVKELVHLLHGSIKVDSTLGKGSVFEVSLPINYDAFKSDENIEFIMNDSQQTTTSYKIPENTSPTEGADKNIDILIVEDNEELRHFLVNMLQKDYRILEAADGKSGLDLTVSAMPDLIISDIMMPVMDGIELLEAVKKNHDISHIPFILLSAKASLDDRIQGLEYGADDYITKPFSSSYLKARISSLLKQRDALRRHFTRKSGDISPSIPQITHFDETFINQIVQAVEEGLQNPDFKIEDLADSMNLSRTVFYRKIRSLLGVSPIDFVRDMRIKRAVQLKAQTGTDKSVPISVIMGAVCSVHKICLLCGAVRQMKSAFLCGRLIKPVDPFIVKINRIHKMHKLLGFNPDLRHNRPFCIFLYPFPHLFSGFFIGEIHRMQGCIIPGGCRLSKFFLQAHALIHPKGGCHPHLADGTVAI